MSARKLLAPLVSHRAHASGGSQLPLPSSRTAAHHGRRERYFGNLFGRHEHQPPRALPLSGHELLAISELESPSNNSTPDHTHRDGSPHATGTRSAAGIGTGRHLVLGSGRPRGAHRLGSPRDSPLSTPRASDAHASDEYHRCLGGLFSLYWLLRLEVSSIPSSQGLGESAGFD